MQRSGIQGRARDWHVYKLSQFVKIWPISLGYSMKKLILFSLLIIFSGSSFAAVCGPQGNITRIIPSAGVAGMKLDVPLSGCSCDYDVIWINTESDGGKAMYSAALAAKMSGKVVSATIEDGRGEGYPTNKSITYRYWATCELLALEVF